MADISTALGAQQTFEFDGVAYTVVPWDTFDIQKAYVQYLKRCAYDELFSAKGMVPPAEWDDWKATLQGKLNGGAYDWGGSIYWESMGSPARLRHLTWLTLVYKNPDVTLATVNRMFTDQAKKEELQTILRGLMQDPNSQMPALGPAKV